MIAVGDCSVAHRRLRHPPDIIELAKFYIFMYNSPVSNMVSYTGTLALNKQHRREINVSNKGTINAKETKVFFLISKE